MASHNDRGPGKLTIPAVAAGSFILDLLSKNWARQALNEGTSTPFIPGFIRLTLTANTGAAFSLGSGNGMLMTALATLMTAALVAWAFAKERSDTGVTVWERFGLGCLIGGALGNLADRFVRGRVTDFLEFCFISFPVFNVADMLIDTGIGLLILGTIVSSKAKSQKEGASSSQSDG